MKKFALILFLTIFVLSQLGFYSFYTYQIYCAKQLAKAQLLNQIPEEQLTKISVNSTFTCSDEELNLNGQMFDVVKKISQNGKVYLLCIADKDEAIALLKLSNLIYSGSATDSNGKEGLKVKISLQDLICKEFYPTNENLSTQLSLDYFYDYTPRLNERSGTISLPPPKFCSSNFIISPHI